MFTLNCIIMVTGYTGERCEEDIDECKTLSTPCFQGGLCNNIAGDYYCVCPPGRTGRDCGDIINNCLSDPCNHNGV